MQQRGGPRSWPWWLRIAAAFLALFVVISSGCGPLAPPETPPPTVKLGLAAPFSGVHQREGERILNAVKLAVAERNDQGGIGGRPVEVVAHDDRGDLVQGGAAARRLALDPEVMAALGHPSRPSAEGALPAYRDAHLPAVLLGNVTNERPAPDGLIIQLAPSTGMVARAAADFALQLQARTVAVVAGPLAEDLAQAESLRQAAQNAGLRLLWSEALFPSSTDYRDAVTRLSSVAPDALLIAASLPASAAFWKEAAATARFAIVVGGATAPQDFATVAGPAARTAYYPTPAPGQSTRPSLVDFAERYRQQWGQEPDAVAALAYDAASLLLESMRQAAQHGGVSRSAVQDALKDLRNYGGVTGRVVYDAAGRLLDPSLFFVSAATGDVPGGRSGTLAPPAAGR